MTRPRHILQGPARSPTDRRGASRRARPHRSGATGSPGLRFEAAAARIAESRLRASQARLRLRHPKRPGSAGRGTLVVMRTEIEASRSRRRSCGRRSRAWSDRRSCAGHQDRDRVRDGDLLDRRRHCGGGRRPLGAEDARLVGRPWRAWAARDPAFFGLAGGIVGRIKGSSFLIWFLISGWCRSSGC